MYLVRLIKLLQLYQLKCVSYRLKEADLAQKLNAARAAAQGAADAAAAKEAELQLARQQFEAERAKGQPMEKEIEKYRKQVQEKVFISHPLHLS